MKQWIGVVAAVFIGTQVHAQSDATSGTAFYPSCLAAADIVQGKRPAADSEDAAKQLRQASVCFGAVTAIMKLEPLLKPEFAVCPPPDTLQDSKGLLAPNGPFHHGLSKKTSGATFQQFSPDCSDRLSRGLALL